MIKKVKVLGILLLVLALVFTGCSPKEANEEAPEVTDGEDSDVSTTEPLDTEADTTDDSTTEGSDILETELPVVLNYGIGLDDNGFFEGIELSEYVELFDYNNIEIPANIHTVSDEALETEIQSLLTYFTGTNEVTDRAIEDGDDVNIDYVGSVDGVEFEGGSTGGMGTDVTIGVTPYIDDFLEQLIGHMPGESFDIEVTFPEDYGVETLNGKDAVFAITINYIAEQAVPELTDEFVVENLATYYDWETVDDMRTGMRQEMQDAAVREYIQYDVIGGVTVSGVPETVLNYQMNAMSNYYTTSAQSYGMELEDYLAAAVGYQSMEELYSASSDQMIEIANYDMTLQAIAKDSGLDVTDEVLGDYFLEFYGSEDYSQFEAQYGIKYLKFSVMQELVMDYLIDNAILQ